MENIKAKVAYVRGLADGLPIKDEVEAKLFAAIIEALDSISEAVDENADAINELSDSVDELYDEMDNLYEDEDDEDDEDDFLELICPNCKKTVYFDSDMLESDDELICPCCKLPIIQGAASDEE